MKNYGKLFAVLMICMVILCGCSGEVSVEEKLVGDWIPETLGKVALEIHGDGTCVLGGEYDCIWEVTDAGLEITYPDGGGETVIFEIREITDTSLTMAVEGEMFTCHRASAKME